MVVVGGADGTDWKPIIIMIIMIIIIIITSTAIITARRVNG